jgi:hypothetical protein
MNNHRAWAGIGFPVIVVLLLGAFVFGPSSPQAAQRKSVVVELFTSEGCSSCPPADELLARFQGNHPANGAEIIPLGFHVDYWNYQGWQDRFSAHTYTQRQETYAARFRLGSPYTPQMVVDGQSEFAGNDSRRAQQAIAEAATQPQTAEIQLSWTQGDKLVVHATATGSASQADVLLAVTEDNLSSNVGAGENQGRVLHHAAVVRDLRRLGQLRDGQFQGELAIKAGKDWKTKDLRVIAFVQSKDAGPILGATSVGWEH